jgi:hypothetical protein
MDIGDPVEWESSGTSSHPAGCIIIGEIVESGGEHVWEVIEAHAFHQVWGASNAMRGERHTIHESMLKPVRSGWRHIVKEGMASYRRKNPGKYDKARERTV